MSVPYIGAKISLTSRSAIRYEGILATVNPKEATISLEKVRMMGTEGRRPGSEIKPSNDVYDMVIFRSNDIEDLQIFEHPSSSPPKQQQPSLADPAIVSSSNFIPAASKTESTGNWPTAPRLQFGTATSLGTIGQPKANTPSVAQFGSLKKEQPTSLTWENEPFVNSKPTPTFGSVLASEPISKPPSSLMQQNLTNMNSVGLDNSFSRTMKTETEKVMAYNTATGKIELVERQTRSFASVVSDGAGRFKVTGQSTPRVVPKNDYDFQQANARLQKESLPESSSSKESFYDKNISFFDKISCESTIGKDGQNDKNERKWNIETFGIAAPSHRGSGHRGGYRRGSYRGGRGGSRGNSHNQDHQ